MIDRRDPPPSIDVLALKYGPVTMAGPGFVTLTAHQWHRVLVDLAREKRTSAGIARVLERVVAGLATLESYLPDAVRARVPSVRGEVVQALDVIRWAEERDGDG